MRFLGCIFPIPLDCLEQDGALKLLSKNAARHSLVFVKTELDAIPQLMMNELLVCSITPDRYKKMYHSLEDMNRDFKHITFIIPTQLSLI